MGRNIIIAEAFIEEIYGDARVISSLHHIVEGLDCSEEELIELFKQLEEEF